MSNIEKYRQLCSKEPSIPLFSQDWWLDATIGVGQWDVALVSNGEGILASMPYAIRKRYGFRILSQPNLSQFLGPWLRNTGAKEMQRLSNQKKWMSDIIEQLPKFDHFSQSWDSQISNWLPFYWKGFEQTTRYSYVLRDISDSNRLWVSLAENIRGDIKKARDRFKISVRADLTINEFIELNNKTFQRQGLTAPYSDGYLKNLDAICAAKNARQILIAEDSEGRFHAGTYIVWDQNSAYYLMGGGDPELRNSGATSLCLWEAIQFASQHTKQFNFEGSMIEPIEKFFRAFGTTQIQYFSITKTPSTLLKMALFLRDLKK